MFAARADRVCADDMRRDGRSSSTVLYRHRALIRPLARGDRWPGLRRATFAIGTDRARPARTMLRTSNMCRVEPSNTVHRSHEGGRRLIIHRIASLAFCVAFAQLTACAGAPTDAGDVPAAGDAVDAFDAPIDQPEVATSCGADPACPSNQLCAYQPGCSATPVLYCGDNTCGDAIAIFYCGCDGVTFVSGCLHLARPFAHAGPCEDAGGTIDATGAD